MGLSRSYWRGPGLVQWSCSSHLLHWSLISSLSYSLVSSLLATGYSVLEAAVDIAPSAVECGYDMAISVSSVLFRAGAAVITFISSSISVISSLTYSLVSGTISCLVTAANISASAVGQAIHGTAHLCLWLWDTMSVVATHGLNVSDIIGGGAITITYVIGDAISSVFSFIFSLISRVVDFLPRDLPLWHDTEQANAHTQGQTESEDMRYDWWALTLNVVPRAIGVLLIGLFLTLTLNYRQWLLQQCGQVIQHYLLPQGGDNQDGGGHQLENDVAGVGNGHQIGADRPGDGGGGHQLEIAGNRAPQISNVVHHRGNASPQVGDRGNPLNTQRWVFYDDPQRAGSSPSVTSTSSASDLAGEVNELLCVVCMDEKRRVLLTPCNHYCVCENCSLRLRGLCPMCRRHIDRSVVVFLS